MNESIFVLAGARILTGMVVISTFKLFFAVGVGALISIFAVSFFSVIFAQLGLILGLYLIFRMPEFAIISLPALVLEEVATHPIPL